MTSADVFKALRFVFPSPAYTRLSQVRNGTGFSRRQNRTADALVVSTFPSRGLYLAGVEIKVYLNDWKRELANGDKSEEIAKYCDYWYIAAPAGLIPQNEMPPTWGLIEVHSNTAKVAIKPKKLKPNKIDILIVSSPGSATTRNRRTPRRYSNRTAGKINTKQAR